jgi:hypothetical protein
MRWVIIVIGALAALIIAIFAAGAVLPRKHVASMAARIAQPQQAVWQTISNHADDPKWRPELAKIERMPDREVMYLLQGSSGPPNKRLEPVWLETYKNGMKLELEDMEVVPPKRLVRIVRDTGNMFGGSWTIDITPNGDNACTVKITENGEVPNPFFRFMSRFVFGHTKSMEQYLTALASKYGEPHPALVTTTE